MSLASLSTTQLNMCLIYSCFSYQAACREREPCRTEPQTTLYKTRTSTSVSLEMVRSFAMRQQTIAAMGKDCKTVQATEPLGGEPLGSVNAICLQHQDISMLSSSNAQNDSDTTILTTRQYIQSHASTHIKSYKPFLSFLNHVGILASWISLFEQKIMNI